MFRLLTNLFLLLIITLCCNISIVMAKKDVAASLEQASEFARTQSKGKVLSAKTTMVDGEKAYRVQVVTPSGRVKVYQIPEASNDRNKVNRNNRDSHVSQPNSRARPRANSRRNSTKFTARQSPNTAAKPPVSSPKQK